MENQNKQIYLLGVKECVRSTLIAVESTLPVAIGDIVCYTDAGPKHFGQVSSIIAVPVDGELHQWVKGVSGVKWRKLIGVWKHDWSAADEE